MPNYKHWHQVLYTMMQPKEGVHKTNFCQHQVVLRRKSSSDDKTSTSQSYLYQSKFSGLTLMGCQGRWLVCSDTQCIVSHRLKWCTDISYNKEFL